MKRFKISDQFEFSDFSERFINDKTEIVVNKGYIPNLSSKFTPEEYPCIIITDPEWNEMQVIYEKDISRENSKLYSKFEETLYNATRKYNANNDPRRFKTADDWSTRK